MTENGTLYTYVLSHDGSIESYDEAMAVACIQGIINRGGPSVYVLSGKNNKPWYWLDVLSSGGRWLEGRETDQIPDLTALVCLAGDELKGVVIWDPDVPASINVANTIAGLEDAVVLSPGFADRYLPKWGLPVIRDLRGQFTGEETGSKKNDAYRWAIREFLAKGMCSDHFLCLYEDTFTTRERGDIGYVVTRDWAVYNKAFVYDLSPWGDEKPGDDLDQPMGTDLATYKMLLDETLKHTAGKSMTEVAGFFAFSKYSNMPDHESSHDPVPTEWETVYLISPYNCYQNTVASDCYNQSLHIQAPFKPLKQHRPSVQAPLENKTYLCVLLADFDSATPLYDFMPRFWDDPNRGKVPLAWGINPNLIETFPDIISYLYGTATDADYFTADASAAGYMNPNRIDEKYLPMFIEHNKRFFDATDMTIAPMVLDWDEPTPAVKDAFTHISPDGFATIVMDMHDTGGKNPTPHVWKGMPVMELINDVCNFATLDQSAAGMSANIPEKDNSAPTFHFFRIVWVTPKTIMDSVELLKQKRPELSIELVDPYTFFRLFKESEARKTSE